MARQDVTIASTGGIATSIYPDGIPALASSGNIRYIGNPVHDAEITIVGDGTIDFGTTSAYLLQALKLDLSSAGTNLEITADTIEAGQQVLSTAQTNTLRFPIQTAAGLPYGIGLAIGLVDNGGGGYGFGTIETLLRSSTDIIFKHEYGVFLAANQANCISGSDSGSQCKGDWEYYSADGYASAADSDVYTGLYGAGQSFIEPPLAASNFGFIGSVVYPVPGSYNPVRLDSTHFRTTLACRQSTITFSKTAGSAHMRYLDATDGTLCNYHVNVNIEPTITNPHPDRAHFVGNLQGIYAHLNQHYHLGERIIFGRSAARVEICDTESPQTDWQAVTGITRRVAVCIPVAWSSNVIKVRVRLQAFWGESLVGKYFHLYTHGNATYPAGVFVKSVLITGEVLS